MGVVQGFVLRGTAGGSNTRSILLVYYSISGFNTAHILSTCGISDVCTAGIAYARSSGLLVLPVRAVFRPSVLPILPVLVLFRPEVLAILRVLAVPNTPNARFILGV